MTRHFVKFVVTSSDVISRNSDITFTFNDVISYEWLAHDQSLCIGYKVLDTRSEKFSLKLKKVFAALLIFVAFFRNAIKPQLQRGTNFSKLTFETKVKRVFNFSLKEIDEKKSHWKVTISVVKKHQKNLLNINLNSQGKLSYALTQISQFWPNKSYPNVLHIDTLKTLSGSLNMVSRKKSFRYNSAHSLLWQP